MDTTPYDRVRDEVLSAAARNGRAHTHEVKAMARELAELRAQLKVPPAVNHWPFGPVAGP